VDTSEAGDGELVIGVTYDGRPMATRIDRKKQLYHVSFIPEGTGVYNIEVEHAGMEVPGQCIYPPGFLFVLTSNVTFVCLYFTFFIWYI